MVDITNFCIYIVYIFKIFMAFNIQGINKGYFIGSCDTIVLDEKPLNITALIDTGNDLFDPGFKLPCYYCGTGCH
jgi:hypothetical protein